MKQAALLPVFASILSASVLSGQAPAVVAGLHREGLDPRVRGLVLLGELGCTACHDPGARAASILHRAAPVLAGIRGRVDAGWLRAYLADPRRTDPGTAMPDVLGSRDATERARVAGALSRYLESLGGAEPEAEAPDAAAAARGEELFHTIGCLACHAPRGDHKEGQPAGSVPLGPLEQKYGVDALRRFLAAPHEVRPAGRMPDFQLAPGEARDIAHYLLEGRPPQGEKAPAAAPPRSDPDEVARGRELFGQLGCARCHAVEGSPASPAAVALHQADATKGCLAEVPGAAPRYDLSPAQRADIRAALAAARFAPSEEQLVRRDLAAFNCVACHARGGLGGVAEDRNAFFTSAEPAMGEAGRLPPPLTGVGAKLQAPWLRDTLAVGQRVRPYMKTRMPGFGAGTAALAARLKRCDVLPDAPFRPLPEDNKSKRKITDIGHLLAGNEGMNCISCHTFRGQRSALMGAVDLVDTTPRRLEPAWFYRYMLDPVRFRSTTVMPQFFPDGKSIREDVVGGDATRQLEGLWYYLAEGRNTRQPRGLVRPAMKVAVGDEAVMLRRSVQHTGKRAIGVGYPLGVNLTFDAETLGLDQVWWGEFLDAAPVWTGQGSGAARILGKQRVELPKGPAFVELADPGAPWPEGSRRDLGHRFLGYDLGAQRRPTFRYVCQGVTIEDTPEDVKAEDGARPGLRRTFRLSTGAGDRTLWFRAAVDKELEDLGGGRVRVGRNLELTVDPPRVRIAAGEVRVPVEVRGGAARLVIGYDYVEGVR